MSRPVIQADCYENKRDSAATPTTAVDRDRKVTRNHEGDPSDVWASPEQAASLQGVTIRAVRKACQAGAYCGAQKIPGKRAAEWRIPLVSLPEAARLEYTKRQAKARAAELGIAAPDLESDEPQAASPWEAWDRTTPRQRQIAEARLVVVRQFLAAKVHGVKLAEIFRDLQAHHGKRASRPSIYRWLGRIEDRPPSDWLPLLLPNFAATKQPAEISPEARDYIYREYFCTSKPPLRAVYRRCQREGAKLGWIIPSYGAVKNMIDAEPESMKVLQREGESAFRELFPSMLRDYSTIDLHQVWCADGRRADVFCLSEDGSIGRPWVSAWIEIRSRVVLGFRVGKALNQELTRLSFHDAATNCNALPHECYLDNGREYAAKAITGGSATRNRFKVKPDEEKGLLPMLGINVLWATPYNGRAKPIESFWNTIAKNVDKRADFVGAYCGNKADARPEDCDRSKAVPIARYLAALNEELDAYHHRAHRGHGMDGRSPREVYDELIVHTVVRRPTPQQLAMCLLRRVGVKLDFESRIPLHSGAARTFYTHPKLIDLPRGAELAVWYDPDNFAIPLRVEYEDRFICEATPMQRVPFRNETSMREHQKATGEHRKLKKAIATSRMKVAQSAGWLEAPKPLVDLAAALRAETPEATPLPSPQIPQLVQTAVQPPPALESKESQEDKIRRSEEISRVLRESRENDFKWKRRLGAR